MYPWQSGYSARRLRPLPQPTTAEMLRHMQLYFSDQHIARDLGTALDACSEDSQRAVVEAYAKARRAAPGFKPHSYAHNSHRALLDAALTEVNRAGATPKECPQCQAPLEAGDKRRRYCSDQCQSAARRVADRQHKSVPHRVSRKRRTAAEKPQVRGLREAGITHRKVMTPGL